jgi:hypothetical protein
VTTSPCSRLLAAALAFVLAWPAPAGENPLRPRQEALLQQMGRLYNEGKCDEGLKACEEFFRIGGDRLERWFEVQRWVVEYHAKAGRLEEALKHARVFFDATPEPRAVSDTTRRVMELFKALDKDIARSNAFLEYQLGGPNGPDGQPGTPDDLKNPHEAYPYPDRSERDKGFAEARGQAGDDADASRYRAWTYLYTGRPREGLKWFVDALTRSPVTPGGRNPAETIPGRAREMVWLGVRPIRGHSAGLSDVYAFVALGPAGPDGQPGTPDDLPDPFPALLGSEPLPGPVTFSAEDLQSIREVRESLRAIVADPREPPGERRLCVDAVERTHEALNDWAQPEVRAFFLECLQNDRDGHAQQGLFFAALGAARGNSYHLGGALKFCQELPELLRQNGKTLHRDTENQRLNFLKVIAGLAPRERLTPNVKPDQPPKPPKRK